MQSLLLYIKEQQLKVRYVSRKSLHIWLESQICSHCCSIYIKEQQLTTEFAKVTAHLTLTFALYTKFSRELTLEEHILKSQLATFAKTILTSFPVASHLFSVIFLVESQLYSGELTLEEHILKSQHATTLAKIFVPQESARHWKADFWEAFNIFVPSESARP